MQLKCSRYIFKYISSPAIVEDFILRCDDLAFQTYGRDKHFSRLNQILDQARFLGWPLPRFGSELPEDLTEIPPSGIDHIFENQAKLLVDIAPMTHVMLEDGANCSIKMIPGTTAAGDLVWRCHLLSDADGNPFVQREKKKSLVKIKGTKIVCKDETIAYDEGYLFECFNGDEGIWPVPFLPEFFLDRAIAQKFSPEIGVVEVVFIKEETPVRVIANEIVPWFRALEINYTKALPISDKEIDSKVDSLVSGWNDIKENEQIVLNENSDDSDLEDDKVEVTDEIKLTNVVISLNDIEEAKYHEYENILEESKISSKAEADELRKDPEQKDRAEKWLLAAVNRLRLISNCSNKIGAVIELINKNLGQQILVIQPREKWATKLFEILNQRDIKCQLFEIGNETQINKFYEGEIQILITQEAYEDLFADDQIIISVSSVNTIKWLGWLNQTHIVYCIAVKQLGFNDYNYVPENPDILVEIEEYTGPSLDILKIEGVKPAKVNKPKFKIKISGQAQGRPKTASTYEKAIELAKKQELEGKKCEVYGPDSEEAMYISGIGELSK